MINKTQDETINEVVKVSLDDVTLTHINTANKLSETVKVLKITNQEEYVNSAEFLKKIKTVSKMMDSCRKEITIPLDALKKRVISFFRYPENKLLESESMLKQSILTYQQEQERIRAEEEAKAIAKARAEEERKRKVLEDRSKKAQESGNIAKYEMLKEKAEDVYVPIVIHAPNIEKVKGISTKKVWKAKIVNIEKIPQNFYINDDKVVVAIQSIINKLAAATKGSMPVDGVEFYKEESLSASRY